MKTSLLISTYNWPEALELVLKSVEQQSQKPDELLIADDGSGEDTEKIIDRFKQRLDFPLRHFWHEDRGFRKAVILNKALSESNGNYIIQADGDCILHKDFVKDHASSAEENTYLFGSRVNIQKEFLPTLFEERKTNFNLWSKGIKKRTRTFRIPAFSKLYKPQPTLSKKVRGCNISYWKKDVLAVNGYNENFKGWGREDSELIIRMMNNGVLGKRLRYKGVLYHIWHTVKDKGRLEKNHEIEEITKAEHKTWCDNGIVKK